ncbi:response regulator [Calditrichota bacterium LG25]
MVKILIVDDSATARVLIRKSIEICGLEDAEFFEAASGREALDVLQRQEVDIVFSDLNMPEMDGVTLLKKIKASPALNHLPVVIITSLKNKASEKALLREHARAVLGKPLKFTEVYHTLHDVLPFA